MSRKRPAPAAPAAPPPADYVLQAAGAAFFLLLAIYLAFPDKVYVFDGIMFSGIIERAVDEWRRELFNRRHLLFNPAMMLLRDGLASLRVVVPGYELIQRVNAVLGALGAFLCFAAARAASRDGALSALCAAFTALSLSYWSRATEGQVYMVMTFWALASGWLALRLLDEPTPAGAAALCASFAAGVLFHAADALLAPMVFYALARAAKRRGWGRFWWAPPAAAGAAALPYAAVFGLTSTRALVSFLRKGSELAAPGASAATLARALLSTGGLGPLQRAQAVVGELGSCAAAGLPGPAAAAAGAALLAAGAACAWAGLRREASREKTIVLLLWALPALLLEAFWLGGDFFLASPLAALAVLAALALAPPLSSPRGRLPKLAAGGVLVGALGAWNLARGILPRGRLENNLGYTRTIFVRDHTVSSSWVVTSGFGYPNAKVYLPYFARRSREVLEYYLDRDPKPLALSKFAAFVRGNVDSGVPLYLLDDLVDDQAALERLEKAFGATPQDIRSCFGEGSLLLAARQDGFSIYLFVPRRAPGKLFAALSYSVLTESDMPRLKETARLLRQTAGLMTPAQKRAAAALLASSDYGFDLLERGFAPYMNGHSAAVAARRGALFAQFQRTPQFHLRLGNVYRYLDDEPAVRREWEAAYALTKDPQLLANLKALK